MSWESLKAEGNAAFQRGAWDSAIEAYTSALALTPTPQPALFGNRALANMKLRRYDAALSDARAAVDLDPAYAKAHPRVAASLVGLGRFQEAAVAAETSMATLREVGGAPPDVVLELQRTALEAREAAAALDAERPIGGPCPDALRAALAVARHRFTDSPDVALAYARARAASDPDAAYTDLIAFANSVGEDVPYLYTRAVVQYHRGVDGLKQARGLLQAVLQMDPENGAAARLLKRLRRLEASREAGNTAFRDKRFADAIERYTEALAEDPQNAKIRAVILGNRAAALMDAGQHEQALADCSAAIDGGNEAPKLFARRSRIHEALEQWDEAVRDMSRASELDGSYRSELQKCKGRARQGKRKDFYKILGVTRDASTDELKRAYKKSALQWHPDRWSHGTDEEKKHAEDRFKELGEAQSILTDPQKRVLYDRGQLDNDTEGAQGGAGGMGGFRPAGSGGFAVDPADLFSAFAGMPMGGMGRGGGNHYSFSF